MVSGLNSRKKENTISNLEKHTCCEDFKLNARRRISLKFKVT